MVRPSTKNNPESARAFALKAAQLLSDLKCTEVMVIDLVGRSQVCDFMVLGSGTSARQMKSVGESIDKMGSQMGSPAWRMDSDSGSSWIVVDFVDVVVHLFEMRQRAFYDLEGLWREAPRLAWRATDRTTAG
ncbi:MAG: ribosome silencing factor [Planctomycetes bacterium]|jgi:ribosome-associated protein|nr:ribosome silencing factor [Planctomycetota bacterium]